MLPWQARRNHGAAKGTKRVPRCLILRLYWCARREPVVLLKELSHLSVRRSRQKWWGTDGESESLEVKKGSGAWAHGTGDLGSRCVNHEDCGYTLVDSSRGLRCLAGDGETASSLTTNSFSHQQPFRSSPFQGSLTTQKEFNPHKMRHEKFFRNSLGGLLAPALSHALGLQRWIEPNMCGGGSFYRNSTVGTLARQPRA
jgi:hypothetical protein